jgi:uncharacterized protein with PIN domain
MPKAIFRFFAELNDFLPASQRQLPIEVNFSGHESVKHLLESLGVPHTEVDVILVNARSVNFSARLMDSDEVQVYPSFQGWQLTPLIHLRPEASRQPRFVLDGHLGKLAVYLRLLGFDTRYQNDFNDDELAEISSYEGRILLTRDRGLLKRSQVSQGYCVRTKLPRQQVVEVLRRYGLQAQAITFSRCARCNGVLEVVTKEEVFERLEPKTKLYYDEFRICRDCDQIYWKGSHFERLEKQLQAMLVQAGED